MGGIFGGGGKTVKPPPPTAPPATPQVGEEVGEQARRKVPSGIRATFLTGDLVPSEEFLTGKKKRFG